MRLQTVVVERVDPTEFGNIVHRIVTEIGFFLIRRSLAESPVSLV